MDLSIRLKYFLDTPVRIEDFDCPTGGVLAELIGERADIPMYIGIVSRISE